MIMLALLHRSEHVWEVKSMWILKKEYALVIQILHVKMLWFFPLWSLRCNVRMNEFQIFNQAKQLQDYSKKKLIWVKK